MSKSKQVERAADIVGSAIGTASAAAMVAGIVAGDVRDAAISGGIFGANAGVYATRCDFRDEKEGMRNG